MYLNYLLKIFFHILFLFYLAVVISLISVTYIFFAYYSETYFRQFGNSFYRWELDYYSPL